MKGGIPLPDQGYIEVLAYTSAAQIPLENVAVTVTSADGTALAMRLTNRNGSIDRISIPVPEQSASQTPDTGIIPFTAVNLYARLEGYEQFESKNLQVFSNTITRLNMELIPLSELPSSWDKVSVYNTPPQNL